MSDLSWHFLPNNRRLQYPPHTLVEAGRTYAAVGRLVLCHNGMHASARALDALGYAPGSVVCRVALRGQHLHDSTKCCARKRTVLWLAEAAPVLHEFACLLAEQALNQSMQEGRLTDPCLRACVASITTKRAWLRGEVDDAVLEVAREAAWRSYVLEDWNPGGCAPWAAAILVPQKAALAAARALARASARRATREAVAAAGSDETAREAAGDAAWSAAWNDCWSSMHATIERMLLQLAPTERISA